jgi:hypothetical protein
MSESPTLKSNTYLEAPASWNTKYLSPEGFVCQITLRSDTGRELLDKAQVAITHLIETGCTPCEALTFRPKSNGNGNGNGHTPQADSGTTPANGNNGNGSGHVCPVHNVEMRRFEKEGKIWYSHKTDDGAWCNGKKK